MLSQGQKEPFFVDEVGNKLGKYRTLPENVSFLIVVSLFSARVMLCSF